MVCDLKIQKKLRLRIIRKRPELGPCAISFLVVLITQALIEPWVGKEMNNESRKALVIYPEERAAVHPTTNKMLTRF